MSLDAPAGLTFNPTAATASRRSANAAYQHLAAGATTDGGRQLHRDRRHGATTPATLTMTITGTNDAPTVGAVADRDATEGDAAHTRNLLGAASDKRRRRDGDAERRPTSPTRSTAAARRGAGGVSLAGSLQLRSEQRRLRALADGRDHDHRGSATPCTDEHGATARRPLTITLTGTNDAPVGERRR